MRIKRNLKMEQNITCSYQNCFMQFLVAQHSQIICRPLCINGDFSFQAFFAALALPARIDFSSSLLFLHFKEGERVIISSAFNPKLRGGKKRKKEQEAQPEIST